MIISAHAGITYRTFGGAFLDWDHPRACGDHIPLSVDSIPYAGSSPRMRGSRRRESVFHKSLRIIPAHAGITQDAQQRSEPNPDHPRACGDHTISLYTVSLILGSSPRMRGSLCRCGRLRARGRLKQKDHPRACGDHLGSSLPTITLPGSSPRMRGSPPAMMADPARPGIIPAHAGITSCHDG